MSGEKLKLRKRNQAERTSKEHATCMASSCVGAGRKFDKSTSPLYLSHLKAILAAYTKSGCYESAKRKFAILSLHQAAGRAAEMAAVNFEGSEWDPYFTAVFSEVGQTKNAKIKIACFVAGKDQYCCFFTCLGDLFALDEEFARNADDTTLWVNYELSIIILQPADFGENPN